jgi:hypothetical protein
LIEADSLDTSKQRRLDHRRAPQGGPYTSVFLVEIEENARPFFYFPPETAMAPLD